MVRPPRAGPELPAPVPENRGSFPFWKGKYALARTSSGRRQELTTTHREKGGADNQVTGTQNPTTGDNPDLGICSNFFNLGSIVSGADLGNFEVFWCHYGVILVSFWRDSRVS